MKAIELWASKVQLAVRHNPIVQCASFDFNAVPTDTIVIKAELNVNERLEQGKVQELIKQIRRIVPRHVKIQTHFIYNL